MKITRLLNVVLLTLLTIGCASTGGSYKPVSTPLSDEQTKHYTDLIVSLQPAPTVTLAESDKFRMTKLITEDVKSTQPTRFNRINSLVPTPTTLQASVVIKRYDQGSALYRLLLMGLGQIHIDADVMLLDAVTKNKLAQYEVTKTFAWGGYAGALIGIKDAEIGFCKAVADAILGKQASYLNLVH